MSQFTSQSSVGNPNRWGLHTEVIEELPQRLLNLWERYRSCFRTTTRDQSDHAFDYLSGILRMETNRNFAAIGRVVDCAGENIQHFMSNSPWSTRSVIDRVQAEIIATPYLQGGVVVVDESADAKAGLCSAGTSRQYNGRLGKVDVCQVGVFLAFVKENHRLWVDAELFLSQAWFSPEHAELRRKVGLPKERSFQTKVELAWEMIQRARTNGLPFEIVACDDLYGRVKWFRSKIAHAELLYVADVPCTTTVYLAKPKWGVPPRIHTRGRRARRPRVSSAEKPVTVQHIAQDSATQWHTLTVRSTERGALTAQYSAALVWTLRDRCPTQEWLFMRQDTSGDVTYSFINAPSDTPLEQLAWMEAQRYFVERANQDSKSEIGWDEFRAIKFRAWEHQAAMTILAAWFITQTQLDWRERCPRDPTLVLELGVDRLPELSIGNVRELLRAVMPLPRLSLQEARSLIVEHLLNRTRSRKSRLKRQQTTQSAGASP